MLVSATNGKTTTTAMVAEILRPRVRVAHNSSGANLVSGVASTLLRARGAELGLFEVDEAALPEVARRVRPKALLLGEPLPRPARPLRRARARRRALARRRSASLPDARARRERRRPAGRRPRHAAARARGSSASTTRGVARPALQHAADSKYCLRCGTPYDYAAAYVGHLGDYRCPNCGHARPPLDVAAREIELHGLDGAAFTLDGAGGRRPASSCALPGLYNVYNALGAGVALR